MESFNKFKSRLSKIAFFEPLRLWFNLLTTLPKAPVSGQQEITVVSDYRSMVLTYIDDGSVDTAYYIRHNWAAQQSWVDLVLSRKGSASGRRNPAGSTAKHAVTRVISGSVTPGKGPLPGTPSF